MDDREFEFLVRVARREVRAFEEFPQPEEGTRLSNLGKDVLNVLKGNEPRGAATLAWLQVINRAAKGENHVPQ